MIVDGEPSAEILVEKVDRKTPSDHFLKELFGAVGVVSAALSLIKPEWWRDVGVAALISLALALRFPARRVLLLLLTLVLLTAAGATWYFTQPAPTKHAKQRHDDVPPPTLDSPSPSSSPSPSPSATTPSPTTASATDAMAAEILKYINDYRADGHLRRLSLNHAMSVGATRNARVGTHSRRRLAVIAGGPYWIGSVYWSAPNAHVAAKGFAHDPDTHETVVTPYFKYLGVGIHPLKRGGYRFELWFSRYLAG
jgi:hypothetical protein